MINAAPVLGREMVTPKFLLFSLIIYTFCDKLPLMNEWVFFCSTDTMKSGSVLCLKITLFIIQDHQIQYESNNLSDCQILPPSMLPFFTRDFSLPHKSFCKSSQQNLLNILWGFDNKNIFCIYLKIVFLRAHDQSDPGSCELRDCDQW